MCAKWCITSKASANMCQEVRNFRRSLLICAKWCTTFGGLCEYVPSGAQLSEASMNMCQEVHNFRRSLRICAKWCTTFGGLCEYVLSGDLSTQLNCKFGFSKLQ